MLKQQKALKTEIPSRVHTEMSRARSASYPAQRHRAVQLPGLPRRCPARKACGAEFTLLGTRGQLWAGPGPPLGPACEGLRLCSRWEGLQGTSIGFLEGGRGRGTIWTALCFSGRTSLGRSLWGPDREGIPQAHSGGSSEAPGAEMRAATSWQRSVWLDSNIENNGYQGK